MPTTPLDLPVLISQMPYAARLTHVEQASADIQKQLYNPLIHENIQKEQSKVQEVNKRAKTSRVDRDGSNDGQQAQSNGKRKDKEPEEEQETNSANASPWSGNIVNVKI